MNSISKSKSIATILATAILFSAFYMFGTAAPTVSAYQGPINLAITAGANQTATNQSFQAPATGANLIVTVTMTRTTEQRDTRKRLRVRLLNGNNNQLLQGGDTGVRFVEVVNGQPRPVNVTLNVRGPFAAGSRECIPVRIELTNPGDSATQAAGAASVNIAIMPLPISTNFPASGPFGLSQNEQRVIPITVPHSGNMTITGAWDTDEFSPEAFQLRFELLRNNNPVANAADTGFAQNAFLPLGGHRLQINVNVADASGCSCPVAPAIRNSISTQRG